MRTLILDQFDHQPLLKRCLWNTFTGLAWGFWVYLWVPLFFAITSLLGLHPEQTTTAASSSILALLVTLGTHATMVGIMVVAFFAWSLLQWLGKRYRHQALRKQQAGALCPPSSPAKVAQNLRGWQQAQCLVVSHDSAGGIIQQVKILKPKNRMVRREFPSPFPRIVPPTPNSIRSLNSNVRMVHR
jgi:poly-beta-1,6-N-acetyl-D-glucosamine biosynthesis protein PgaD